MDAHAPHDPALADADPAEAIAASALFDPAHYAREAGAQGTAAELALHYLAVGEPAFLSPSPGFDVRFYRQSYPDAVRTGMSPLLHYVRHGWQERRYRTLAQLRADAGVIAASGLFDAAAYAWLRGRPPLPGLSDIEDHLIRRDTPVPPVPEFDSDAYARMYPDSLARHATPMLHYLHVGRAQHHVTSQQDLARRKQAMQPRFNPRCYLAQLPPGLAPHDPLEHYILHGALAGLDPAPDFSADYYLRRYPELRTRGGDPFLHFCAYGAAEGRSGRPDLAALTRPGAAMFDLSKPTILVTSHEASRTGAPLVALALAERLAATHNVICGVGRGGPLLGAFGQRACLLVCGSLDALDAEYVLNSLKRTHALDAVLVNSVETGPFAVAALQAELPCVALLHEFAEYTLPAGRMTAAIEAADRVVVPAALIERSAQAEVTRFRLGPARTIDVHPQGCLPRLPENDGQDEGEDDGLGHAADDLTRDDILALMGAPPGRRPRVVLGAGFVHMRKGVDLFVQTAAEVARLPGGADVRFLWVGGGYDPLRDLTYSAWVADMVRRLGLERTVLFLPEQSGLDTLFALADVFYLPSRLDPFPNVLLDALRAGRAVVCFDGATGAAGLFQGDDSEAQGTAAPYLDVAAAARALLDAMRPAAIRRAARNAALVEERFSFAGYADALMAQMELARESRAGIAADVARIEASGLFDAAFHDGAAHPMRPAEVRRSIRAYAARARKGLLHASPRPGFNEGGAAAALDAALDPASGPALAAPGAPAATHRCLVQDGGPPALPFSGRAALHLHLHYPGLIAEALEALAGGGSAADLIVTTTSEAKRIEIAYALRRYAAGSAQVLAVPNRGRDIGPFLTEVGGLVRGGGYDVVGHLHGKRSLGVDPVMGDRWRAFLFGTLLGGADGIAGVLSPFEDDASLGLLFAEDRHVVGWTDNRAAAAALAARLVPAPVLPAWPVFPLGTMFWARPAALEPLWALGLAAEDFPAEPLAADGTLLHAVERMLPAVCESVGHSWCTVHRPGLSW